MRRIGSALALVISLNAGAALSADPPTWPRQFIKDGNELAVYQPQLDTWADRVSLNGRAAVIVTASGAAPAGGVLRFSAQTDVDQAQRTVTLSQIAVTEATFPSATPADAQKATAVAKQLLPTGGVVVSLDYLLAALAQTQTATSVALNTTPPQIYVAEQPARLVLFDGAPAFAAVAGTSVQHALNTNWPLLRDGDAGAYYLLDSTGWLTAESLATGPWEYTEQLPQSFSTLPDQQDWQEVRAAIPAPRVEGQPPLEIYVSTVPAELISVVGAPQYERIPNTGLYAVQNTDSVLFWDGYAKAYYYLTAGRWFRATALAGPWAYASGNLPSDFTAIPADGPHAGVLASVPGTPEAREASLQAQIPHLATVSKTITASAAYNGAAEFAPIAGTAMSYAVNTPDDVVKVGDAYYLCKNGVWFTSPSPDGPWTVATAVPDAIYTIPPSSPLYNVTYVRLYDTDADDVVYGYTDGYLGEYVSDGVVTWGTGYYYPPYLAVGTLPYYYARPYTYGADSFYNPVTGRFHRAGYGYGPYGGIGAGSVYVPSTGAYARGVAAYGPTQSGAAVEGYNPRTGVAAAGYARSNPYASWEQGVVYGPERSARAASYSDDRGSVAAVRGSDGGAAVAVSDGDGSAAAVRAPDGNWYAGGDGNIYRRSENGWEGYGGAREGGGVPGLGRPVDAGGYVPSRPAPESRYVPSYAAPQSRYVPSTGMYGGLDNAWAAQQRSAMMQQRYRSWGGGGGFAGGRYGGGGFRGGGGRR